MFNHHAFRDRVRLSGVNSINWARIVAQVVYYFTAAVALGAPHRKVAFTVPTGNFGDIFAGYVADAHGPADRPAGRSPPTSTTSWRARSRPATYEMRERGARPRRRRWTSRSRRISSGCCSRPIGRDAAAGARADGRRSRSRGASRSPRTALAAIRARVRRRPRRRGRDRRRPSAPRCARPATCSIRTPRSASRSPRRKRAIRRCRWSCSSTAHPAKFPDAVEAACGVRPALPDWLADLDDARRARHRAAGRSGGGRDDSSRASVAPRAKELPHERRSHPSRLRPDGRHRRHAASARRASLGVWVGSGSRDEQRRRARHLASARAHGVQGHRAAHRAPDRRGDRGGRRRPQCRDQRRDDGLLRARAARPTCRSRSTSSPTS